MYLLFIVLLYFFRLDRVPISAMELIAFRRSSAALRAFAPLPINDLFRTSLQTLEHPVYIIALFKKYRYYIALFILLFDIPWDNSLPFVDLLGTKEVFSDIQPIQRIKNKRRRKKDKKRFV